LHTNSKLGSSNHSSDTWLSFGSTEKGKREGGCDPEMLPSRSDEPSYPSGPVNSILLPSSDSDPEEFPDDDEPSFRGLLDEEELDEDPDVEDLHVKLCMAASPCTLF